MEAKVSSSVEGDFSFRGISFPSVKGSTFRLWSVMDANGWNMKIEKEKSPKLWTITVNDLSKHGPVNLPTEAVVEAFKKSADNDLSVEIDAHYDEEENLILTLAIILMQVPLKFTFHFTIVAKGPLEVLETALKDAEEETNALKKEVATLKATISAKSTKIEKSPCLFKATCTFTTNGYGSFSATTQCDEIKIDRTSVSTTSIRVKEGGCYLINAKSVNPSTGGSPALSVYLNGGATLTGENLRNSSGSCNCYLSEVLTLGTNSILQIYGSNINNVTTTLTICKLA